MSLFGNYFIRKDRANAEEKLPTITNNPPGNRFPVWSPDGKRIAFVSGRDGNLEIYLMNADGSGQRNLTKNPLRDFYPTWSPNGKQIAFVSEYNSTINIYLMNADGSKRTLLTKDVIHNDSPSWSSNGQQIAFAGSRGFYVINANGSGLIPLQDNNLPLYPVWSPDGKRILLASSGCNLSEFEIYTVNADGTQKISLLKKSTKNSIYRLAWSPDGKQIIFVSKDCQNDSSQLYIMNANGSKLRRLLSINYFINPSWSPNSKQIALDFDSNIYVMNADGSKLTNLSKKSKPSKYYDEHPVWSPDGKKIAFESSTLESVDNIYVMKADGSGRTQLTK
ncbi:PD40 domain-containing protein [Nostoc sp. CENA67]|uniref:PD40 domain-containing protein n=1 Tax=Amazonocrinis nigriterrae CENA67 TaxID=2794033 RepID=A0A8J7I0P3_9NOST|nr:DPP IV N-terminal domain-containing protein [Amazonocrinis nigriterrae]MBH8566957.1 PD40 domain-containing protein [Amazonocrinis nigriterrae CENA67]